MLAGEQLSLKLKQYEVFLNDVLKEDLRKNAEVKV